MTREFADRRKALMCRLEGGAALFAAAPETIRNNDVHNEYRQDSDLWYLSGFGEPEAVLLLRPGKEPDAVMFVRPRDRAKEVWNGFRAGPEGVVERFGIPKAHPLEDIEKELPKYLEGFGRLYYRMGRDHAFDRRVLGWLEPFRSPRLKLGAGPVDIMDPAATLHEMRLVKAPEELRALREAGRISAEAHTAAMRVCAPGMHEYELEAVVEYVFRRSGSARLGYPCIVGAGINSTILHYNDNCAPIRDGELVLIDAGCEVDYYTADITRTWPANGRFTKPQRAVYEVVLEAQLAAIECCRTGRRFDEVHDVATRCLVEGMVRLGLLTGSVDTLISESKYKRLYMHRTSHWLGLDVHDVGRYATGDGARMLEPGQVLTVEPGIYVAHDDQESPAEYRGIGVRIEDDVLVTGANPEVLTAGVPKSVAELERECSRRIPLPTF